MVPVNHVNGTSVVKEAVAEVMILEHSIKKELFFFPGLRDVPMKGIEIVIHAKVNFI